jgi:hypothetical protein
VIAFPKTCLLPAKFSDKELKSATSAQKLSITDQMPELGKSFKENLLLLSPRNISLALI